MSDPVLGPTERRHTSIYTHRDTRIDSACLPGGRAALPRSSSTSSSPDIGVKELDEGLCDLPGRLQRHGLLEELPPQPLQLGGADPPPQNHGLAAALHHYPLTDAGRRRTLHHRSQDALRHLVTTHRPHQHQLGQQQPLSARIGHVRRPASSRPASQPGHAACLRLLLLLLTWSISYSASAWPLTTCTKQKQQATSHHQHTELRPS